MSSQPASPSQAVSIAPLWRGLIDDAAVFPPGNAPVSEAVAHHAKHRTAWYSSAVGPLLLPVAGVEKFVTAVAEQAVTIPRVSLAVRPGASDLPAIADAVTTLSQVPGTTVAAVEMAIPHSDGGQASAAKQLINDAIAALPEYVDLWLELQSAHDTAEAMKVIAAAGPRVGAKYRMGGTTAQGFPTVSQAMTVFGAAAQERCQLKLTAGLHHLHRFDDRLLGVTHHGFGNVLLAVHKLLDDPQSPDAREALSQDDPAETTKGLAGLTDDHIDRLRTVIASFGCCGVTDPINDVVADELQPGPAT